MNKRKVDALIPQAYNVLQKVGIAVNGKINSAWRGQISSFGASVAQGSLLAAVSFFSAQGGAEVDRSKLMAAIFELLDEAEKKDFNKVCEYVQKKKKDGGESDAKENIMNAAVALKLAMNLYDLDKGGGNGEDA